MPGGDRTGPWGSGPMTGRGAGFCAGYSMPGYMNPIPGRGWYGVGRGGFPRGGGRGRAFGGGRGWWRGGFYGHPSYAPFQSQYAPYPPAYHQPSAEEEKKFLQEELASLEDELTAIRERIGELEKGEQKKK
jgi:hypothetical protein